MYCPELPAINGYDRSFRAHVQAIFSPNRYRVCSFPLRLSRCLTSPGCTCVLLLVWFYPVLFWCLHRNPVVVQILCLSRTSAWKCHVQLWSSSLGSVANFFFFNPHQEPRNLYQLTQLLALVLKAEVQWGAGQIISAGRYCAAVYFGSTDAIYSCVQCSGVTNSQEWNLGLVHVSGKYPYISVRWGAHPSSLCEHS